jgi:hypothetical protein
MSALTDRAEWNDYGLAVKLSKCPEHVRDAFERVDKVVRQFGGVEVRHMKNGPGRAFARDGRIFFRMDPKPQKQHICARIVGLPPAVLEAVGPVSLRKEGGWMFLKDMGRADLLAGLALRAYGGISN